MKQNMKTYVTPELYAVVLSAERGFADSRWLDGESSSTDYSISSDVDEDFV